MIGDQACGLIQKKFLTIEMLTISNILDSNYILEGNYYQRLGKILVKLPRASITRLRDLKSCAQRILNIGATASYYVPTEEPLVCSNSRDKSSGVFEEIKSILSAAFA